MHTPQATSLQELYENNRGRLRRDSVALACELQEQAECTFAPNLHKPGPCGAAPAEAKLSMSAEVGGRQGGDWRWHCQGGRGVEGWLPCATGCG